MKKFTIQLKRGPKEVEGSSVTKTDGVLAVTKHPDFDYSGWAITHIASGLAVGGYFTSKVQASMVARGLWQRLTKEQRKIVKEGKPISCRGWKAIKWYQDQLNRYGA